MSVILNKKLENNQVELEIQVTAQEFKSAVDNAFRVNVKRISVPGFRKGKAPRSVVEKMYGVELFYEDAINECYPKAYMDAIDEMGVEPVERANIEIVDEVTAEGFTFKATVTVKPEVTLGQYKGVTAEKTVPTVEDSEVLEELKKIAEKNARVMDVADRPTQEGDTAVINFEGFIDDVAFEGGKGENFPLVLGSGQFIPGFEAQVMGHNIDDEFDVNVNFPEEYHAEELKGKPAVFKVKVLEIKTKELPEIDDEFVKDISEFDTLAELQEDMKKKMLDRKTAASEDEYETKLLETVVSGMQVDLPQVMIDNRVDEMVRDFEYRLRSQGLDLQTYLQYTGSDLQMMRKTFAVQGEQQVKTRLALEAVAKAENLEVTPEEIENEYVAIATRFGAKVEDAKKSIHVDSIRNDISCNKAIDFIKENAGK